jgi:hypothetical protein
MRANSKPIILTDASREVGRQLLDHQCWVLGRDVLSPEGNLLSEFGFRQVRCPSGGLTQYELKNALGQDVHVYLWGFGIFFGGENEGIFLGRRDFKPSQTFGRIELHAKDYPDFGEVTSRLDLLLQGLAWFPDYEQWIAQRMPEGYREMCLSTFPRRTLPGNEFTQRWRDLIHCIEQDQHVAGMAMANHESTRKGLLSEPASLSQPLVIH